MFVQRLELVDYRSYASAAVDLSPGITVFVGLNGQGKTNLVEALRYVGSLSSHRVATDAPLVREGTDRAIVRCTVVGEGRSIDVDLEITATGANRARLNNAPVTRTRDVLGTLRTVLFAPEDLALVKGEPSERRKFLDELITARLPRFAGIRADYDKVLRQRNTLLKNARSHRHQENLESTLRVWDEQLSEHGSHIIHARLELLAELRPLVLAAYTDLAPDSGETSMEYRSFLGDEVAMSLEAIKSRFNEAIVHARKSELERGMSLVGPHRDDVLLGLRSLPAKGYASHGESWSIALALRLGSYEILRRDLRGGGDPVLILDDVFAELDVRRRERLAHAVRSAEQVLITAAVAQDVPDLLVGQRFDVVRGSVSKAS